MPINRKVIKTGNSLAVTIPTIAIQSFNINEGDLVNIKINRAKASITCIFTGHPRQLALINSQK